MSQYDHSIDGIREHYRRNNGGYWFSTDTLRFWGSRFSEITFTTPNDGSRVWFVSSEHDFHRRTRLYTVRVYDYTTFQVDTVGEFQAYKTLKQAQAAAKFVAGAKVPA
jgi:hypothetical protein